ncbi:hypothetical protein BP6252_05844 [Coleophoma cylindrospora]|uniref:NmrA-like domain-containing protein n=1 Tax=Coleophoma cylindrospora TaxID=1849047 RepID=A0A3D8RVG0_9HELO|nr:hypothetical protein BP6252_05844 [Coleophoma cylindrospora]
MIDIKAIRSSQDSQSAVRKLLITGATGRQGSAVIDALLSKPLDPPFSIIALTRDIQSPKAQALIEKHTSNSNVKVVEGDVNSPYPIFSTHGPFYGVFCYTIPGKPGEEERQAKRLIDASIVNRVEHFIYSSIDRGGSGESDVNPTRFPHFAAKWRNEVYLRGRCAIHSDMQWTILRPVCFMDNLTPNFRGKAFASIWAGLQDTPLQVVSIRDLGLFTARAFNEEGEYKGWTITLAGDDLSFPEAKQIFKLTMEKNLPETFSFVGTLVKFMNREAGTMFKYCKEDGFGGDIEELRKEEPTLQDFETWLKQSSGFAPEWKDHIAHSRNISEKELAHTEQMV